MCGRYTSTTPRDKLSKLFEALVTDPERDESYNVSPQSDVYAVLDDGEARKVDVLRWGFVPGWAKDIKIGNRMINARAESVTTACAYKGAFKRRRAILPADGFYEWKKLPGGKRKQPYYLERRNGDPIALAGLWEEWRGPDRKGEPLRTVTIITTTPTRRWHRSTTACRSSSRRRGTPGSIPPTTTPKPSPSSCSPRPPSS
jgi:putative SOS response-associated peptidase YedK